MRKIVSVFMLCLVLLTACDKNADKEMENWKKEIVNTEHAFAEMARTEGISRAFLTFAADDVAVLRGKELILGKEALKANYEKQSPSGKASLTWAPDFVDVSSSGDLGYTYGRYSYTSTDSLGNVQSDEGIFHTVWKRQADGTWKFVWD